MRDIEMRLAFALIGCCSVYDLKWALVGLTDVPPERQKILGLVKGKLPADEERM